MLPTFTSKSKLLSTAIVTSLFSFVGSSAFAQVTDENVVLPTDSDEIIVTARKREESLQEVPISITAITEDALREANAFGLEDVAQLTAGLQYRRVGGFNEVTVRGLAQVDQTAVTTNVGVFIDGIYLNNRSSIEFGNMDLAQVEVLKGPQSALFGRDTFAGAINYRTKGATLGEFDGMVEADAGSDGLLGIKGSVNVPLGENAAIRVFGGTSKFDGTIDNIRSDDNLGGWDERTTFGASALFEVDKFKLKLFALNNDVSEDNPALLVQDFTANNGGASYLVDDGMGGTQTIFSVQTGRYDTLSEVSIDPRGRGSEGKFELYYANLDVDLGFATLTGNISRSESEYDTFFDNLGDPGAITRPFFGIYTLQFFTNQTADLGEQDSYEIRLASNEGSKFDWLIGYSRYESVTGGVLSTTTPLLADPDTLEIITRVPERLIQDIDAVFAAVNIPVTDKLNIGGEIRNSSEAQEVTDQAEIFFFPPAGRPLTSTESDFNYWSGRVSLDYTLNDDTLLYASASKGIKTGGINAGAAGTPNFTFDPESNWSYEIGAKAEMMDGRARLNAALFYIDWTDLQTQAPATLALGPITFNGVGATSKGIELEGSFDVTDNFTVNVATTIVDPTYNDGFIDAAVEGRCGQLYIDPPEALPDQTATCSSNVSGNQIARTADFTFFGSGTYTIPSVIMDFDGFVRADYSHEASKATSSLNLSTIAPIDLVNLRAGIKNDNTEISLWMDNALDKEYLERGTPINDFGAPCAGCAITSTVRYAANGRTFGITALQRF